LSARNLYKIFTIDEKYKINNIALVDIPLEVTEIDDTANHYDTF
jgi:hypothetical protein